MFLNKTIFLYPFRSFFLEKIEVIYIFIIFLSCLKNLKNFMLVDENVSLTGKKRTF